MVTADGSAADTQRFFHITVLNLGDQTSTSDFCTRSLALCRKVFECERPRTNVTFYLGCMGGDIFGSMKLFSTISLCPIFLCIYFIALCPCPLGALVWELSAVVLVGIWMNIQLLFCVIQSRFPPPRTESGFLYPSLENLLSDIHSMRLLINHPGIFKV